MTTNRLDKIQCVLDENTSSLLLNATGEDRPHLIAEVSEKLDRQKLYIASMSFNLDIARQEISGLSYVPYEMEVL
jgi:glycine cleavage system regulatory protein